MKEELQQFLQKQRPITAATIEAQKEPLSRPARRKLNQLGQEEQELGARIGFLVSGLAEEGNQVYRAVLDANRQDLEEIARRLLGRNPDPGSFTTMLQQDVERRTEDLLAALDRERKRREQEQRDQQQQQRDRQPQNKLQQQRERLVSLIAELEMLKQLELDTQRSANNLRTLVELRSDDAVSAAEVAMIERLADRHGEVTRLFLTIKAAVEQTLQSMEGSGEPGSGDPGSGGRGR
jgi:exonuclease VII large subunit